MNMTNHLHEKALEIAKRFHAAESELIDVLQKIDQERIFVILGFSSLFDYATKALKLSEANASNFITVARKSKSVPELKESIRLGSITVSKARKITPVLTKENSSYWLELAKTLSKQKLEKEVAKVLPQTLTPEKARYVTEHRMELKLGLSETIFNKLKRAQDVASQKMRRAANLEETLEELLECYLSGQDSLKKAERNISNAHASVPRTETSGQRFLPAGIRHQVQLRDQGLCPIEIKEVNLVKANAGLRFIIFSRYHRAAVMIQKICSFFATLTILFSM